MRASLYQRTRPTHSNYQKILQEFWLSRSKPGKFFLKKIMREEELSQGNEDWVNDERQDARRNQLLQYNLEWVNLPLGPNDNINQLFYDRLMLFAQDHNQDVMFYSDLLQHLQNSEIPNHDFMEIFVLRDSVTM